MPTSIIPHYLHYFSHVRNIAKPQHLMLMDSGNHKKSWPGAEIRKSPHKVVETHEKCSKWDPAGTQNPHTVYKYASEVTPPFLTPLGDVCTSWAAHRELHLVSTLIPTGGLGGNHFREFPPAWMMPWGSLYDKHEISTYCGMAF